MKRAGCAMIVLLLLMAMPHEGWTKKIRVLYVGDAGVMLGPNVIASWCNEQGLQRTIWCQPVLDALNAEPDITVEHMANWDAGRVSRRRSVAARCDVVVLGLRAGFWCSIRGSVSWTRRWGRTVWNPSASSFTARRSDHDRRMGSFTGRRGVGN